MHKRHHQQSKFDYLSNNFNILYQDFFKLHQNKNIIKIINNEKQDRYFNRILFNENNFICFSNTIRGPPKLEYFSNFI